MKFAKEGWAFVLPFVFAAAALLWLGHPAWGAGFLVAGLLVLLFFRDPRRVYDGEAEVVLAAADGLVTRIDEVEDPAVGAGRRRRVVTFLSVFDIHVQRVPVAGEVIASRYTAGRKVAAFRADAGEINEQHLTVIRRPNGDLVGVRQIAGLLARRVVCYLKVGDQVHRGQSMGLIKFGSRVDLLVPEEYRVLAAKGDRLKNGATPVAVPAHPATPPPATPGGPA
ncbi:MAG TPA: phosphatidylserine decarboxylase [Thermoanaerobaculia bacterium]|nr:phosphatidylserine decarboxylase [Thermoanaerobaculia bacterium]